MKFVCIAILGLFATLSFTQTEAQTAPAPNREILVHGHRGARAWRPENTIPAFQFAIDHGVDVLELDLAVTKDNVNDTIIKDGFLKAADICTAEFKASCAAAGIK